MCVCLCTKNGANSIHVSVVSFAENGVGGAVAVSEKRRSVVSDKGEQEHDSRASNPAKLSNGPC